MYCVVFSLNFYSCMLLDDSKRVGHDVSWYCSLDGSHSDRTIAKDRLAKQVTGCTENAQTVTLHLYDHMNKLSKAKSDRMIINLHYDFRDHNLLDCSGLCILYTCACPIHLWLYLNNTLSEP